MTLTWSDWRDRYIKAYITGICGFAGSWLAEELINRGYSVGGAALPGESNHNLRSILGKVRINRFDIADPDACRRYLQQARPELLFHLAAFSSVGQSFAKADLTFRVNLMGTINILEAVRNKKWLKKLVFVSSADVYGPVQPRNLPLQPSQPLNPVSPYAASKAAAEHMAGIYINEYRVPIIIARPFNHTGPRQNAEFVISSFCRKIVAAERPRGRKTIPVGNLNAKRDFSDVRDVVRGYRLLAEKGRVGGIYHLCSGKAYSIRELLEKLKALSDTTIREHKDQRLYRKLDIRILQGSYAGTTREIGWKPQIKIDTTLADTLAYWRNRS